MDALALRTFKGSEIGSVRPTFDADQHHAALALRATGPFDRKERWFGTGISLRHLTAVGLDGSRTHSLTEKRGAVMTSPYPQMAARYVHLYTQTKTPLRQNFARRH